MIIRMSRIARMIQNARTSLPIRFGLPPHSYGASQIANRPALKMRKHPRSLKTSAAIKPAQSAQVAMLAPRFVVSCLGNL